jgi:hypothetical protein
VMVLGHFCKGVWGMSRLKRSIIDGYGHEQDLFS